MRSRSDICVNFVTLLLTVPRIMVLYISKRFQKRRIAPFLVMKRISAGVSVQDLTRASVIRRDDDPFVSGYPAPHTDIMPIGNKDMVILPQQV